MSQVGRDAISMALALRPDLIGSDEADALLLAGTSDPLRSFGRAADGEALVMKLEDANLPRHIAPDVRQWLERRADLDAHLEADRRLQEQRFPFPVPRIRRFDAESRTIEHDDPDGVPLADLLGRRADLEALDIDPDAVAEDLLDRTLEAIFERKLFIETLHPNDLAIRGRGDVTLRVPVVVTGLDETTVGYAIRIYRALRDGSSNRAASAVVDLIGARDATRAMELRRELAALMRSVIAGDTATEIVRSSFVVGEAMIEILRIARRHGVEMPRLVLGVALNLITVERISRHLGAKISLREVAREYFEELLLRRAVELMAGQNLSSAAFDVLSTLRDVPGDLQAILSDIADERFRLRVVTSDSDEDRRLKNLRTRMIAAAVTAAPLVLLVSASSLSVAARVACVALLATAAMWLVSAWRRLR